MTDARATVTVKINDLPTLQRVYLIPDEQEELNDSVGMTLATASQGVELTIHIVVEQG